MKELLVNQTMKFIRVLLPGCLLLQASQAADTVIVQWNDQALQAVRDTHPGPPIVARMLAIANTCMYDAWAAYDEDAIGTRLGGTLRVKDDDARSLRNRNQAISYAAYRCLKDLFPAPAQTAMFTSLMTTLGYDPNNASVNRATPAGIGNIAAQAVLDFRHQDGSNQLANLNPAGPYTDYTGYSAVNTPSVVNDPNHWQPLQVSDGHGGFVVQKFIAPFWQNVIPFALLWAQQFRPPTGPHVYGTAAFKQQVDEVLSYSANLTDTQKVIARAIPFRCKYSGPTIRATARNAAAQNKMKASLKSLRISPRRSRAIVA